MELSEQELRAMIRDAVARHVGGAVPAGPAPAAATGSFRRHASHGLLVVPAPGDDACVIEPAVRCDHCGYCKSLGH
jgi:hypothetical protein